jgi:hypothetical protein
LVPGSGDEGGKAAADEIALKATDVLQKEVENVKVD